MMPDNEEKLELWDIIGKNGKQQILSAFVSIYCSTLIGVITKLPEIQAPEVDMYWDWDEFSLNRTTYNSLNCKLENMMKYNKTSHSSRSNSTLIYHSSSSSNTLTKQLGLICEQSWLVSLTNSLVLLGTICGNLCNGIFVERFGRKVCLIVYIIILLILNIALLFPHNYIMLAVLYFGCSTTAFAASIVSFIQVMEMYPPSTRIYFGSSTNAGYALGQLYVAGGGWLFKDWFYIQLSYIVLVIFSLPFIWCTVDSPVWLLSKKQTEKAKINIMFIAKKNGKKDEIIEVKINQYVDNLQEIGNQAPGKLMDLFKNKIIIKYVVLLSFIMMLAFFSIFGLLMNIESFGTTLISDLAISASISIGMLILSLCAVAKISTRQINQIFCILSGIVCALYPFFYNYDIARTIIPASARVLFTPLIIFLYVYAAEVLPTTVRVVGMSFIMWSRLSTLLSPFAKELGEKTVIYVPFILFSACNFIAAFLFMFLPDTRGKPLVQTVDELNE